MYAPGDRHRGEKEASPSQEINKSRRGCLNLGIIINRTIRKVSIFRQIQGKYEFKVYAIMINLVGIGKVCVCVFSYIYIN